MAGLNLDIKLTGPLFSKSINRVAEVAITEEIFAQVDKRFQRRSRSKRAGIRNNTISTRRQTLTMDVVSTLNQPRVTGSAWRRWGMGVIRAMTPRIVRKTAQRITADLGGS